MELWSNTFFAVSIIWPCSGPFDLYGIVSQKFGGSWILRGHSTTTWTELCHFLTPLPSQCVELKLKWRFCVYGSICPEIYLLSEFWIIFDISNTRFWLEFVSKHIWNNIEESVFRNYIFKLLSETISSIMFQICSLIYLLLSKS